MRPWFWILTCAAALLAACGGGGGGGNTTCDTSEDCPTGMFCNASRQCAPGCERDSQCPTGSSCSAGDCVVNECEVDATCSIGSICSGGRCRPGCRNELDCSDPQPICDTRLGTPGTCVECATTDDCPANHACTNTHCVQDCRDDAGCDTGHCDTSRRTCVECTETAHCALGEYCLGDACVPGCEDSTHCPADAPHCSATHRCVECRIDADCGTRSICSQEGACVDGPTRALDVLFVIDDSASMAPEQQALTAAFPTFVNALEVAVGYRPDLHLGVVTTTIGIPQFPGSQDCRQVGFDGALQPAPGGRACLLGDGAFLHDVAVPGAGRDVNYTGSLESAFSCLAEVGDDGCGFEQPFEVLRRALDGSVARNDGFLRPEAALAVIVLSDEDDCSASNPELYSTVNDSLGPRTSFRCFEYGIRCSPDTPRVPGSRTDCAPRDDSPYVARVSGYVDFLRGLRSPERLSVTVIAGPTSPVAVGLGDRSQLPELMPSCGVSTAGPSAAPAIRLAAFASAFGARGSFAPACNDYVPAMMAAAAKAAETLE